jgi:exopolysaccharide production protein ExoQ
MNPTLASLVYACAIAGLFYLDREKSIRTSKALWLPVIYLWAIGSRPVSFWLGGESSGGEALEGSPIDGAFFQILLFAAICVLVLRGRRVINFLTANFPIPILLYFVLCLLSVIWSDYPGPALKKWIKSVGDVAMVLVIVTDEQPVAALRRVFSRLGFILLPVSLLFIKYYPTIGRYYGAWDGAQMNTGVTLDKNLLGVITFVLSLGVLWRFLGLLSREETSADRRRHLWAQGILLALGIWLLIMSNSATSLVCFMLGAGFMWIARRQFMRRSPKAVHALVLTLMVTAGVVMLLGGGASAAHALGRNANLTGRTDIWAAVIPMAPNPLIGAGFECFWLSPLVHAKLWEMFPGLPLNEAHDGYVEVYLNLGWVGVCLIALILIDGYRRAVKAFRGEPAIGALLLAYVLTAVTYNVAEAGFRMLSASWVFFLLAVIEASNFAARPAVSASPPLAASPEGAAEASARTPLALRPSRRTVAGKVARRQET